MNVNDFTKDNSEISGKHGREKLYYFRYYLNDHKRTVVEICT